MAATTRTMRRGLPRRPGAEPWPEAATSPVVEGLPADRAGALAGPAVADAAEPAFGASAGAEVAAAGIAPAVPGPAAIVPAAGIRMRQGMPRRAGEVRWPPDALAHQTGGTGTGAPVLGAPAEGRQAALVGNDVAAATVPETAASAADAVLPAAPDTATLGRVRRGLPRAAGGERWPTAAALSASAVTPASPAAPVAATAASVSAAASAPSAAPTAAPEPATVPAAGQVALRSGLPRTVGGAAWPPAGSTRPAPLSPAAPVASVERPAPSTPTPAQAPAMPVAAAGSATSAPAAGHPVRAGLGRGGTPPTADRAAAAPVPPRPAAPAAPVTPAAPAAPATPAAPAARRYGRYTRAGWARIIVGAVIVLAIAAVAIVLVTRWVMTLTPVHEFMATYPGHYALPATSQPGFPAWVGWQHFFNLFLMVLIIRSGLQVRQQRTPPAYWTSRRTAHRKKVSIMQWLHQSLDALWMANGVVFVVLLFVTTQWMRIVPTSWAVFPNAVSAGLQYLSLQWPLNESWVNFNALQQLAYFATVFLAAPLAAATGYRLSTVWPNRAAWLTRAFPVGLARALHFPTMLYFVVFIIGHVALVLSTGAIRNLNQMWAGINNGQSLIGFALLFGGLVLIAAAWVAARPSLLAPIARLFGAVSAR